MAKNKGTFGKAKSDVELEDEFVAGAGKLVTALEPHRNKIIALGVVVLLAGTGWAIFDWHRTKQAAHTTDELSRAFLTAVAPLKSAEAEPAPGEDALPPPENAFADEAARAQAALEQLEPITAKRGPGAVGQMVEGSVLLDEGKYDEAIAAFRAASGAELPPLARATARENIGYAEEAKALAQKDEAARNSGLEAALSAFEKMQPDEKGPLYARAVFHQGRVLAELGRTEDAIAKFQELDAAGAGNLQTAVDNRLATLQATSGTAPAKAASPAAGAPNPESSDPTP